LKIYTLSINSFYYKQYHDFQENNEQKRRNDLATDFCEVRFEMFKIYIFIYICIALISLTKRLNVDMDIATEYLSNNFWNLNKALVAYDKSLHVESEDGLK
jgi:hypothetical protein